MYVLLVATDLANLGGPGAENRKPIQPTGTLLALSKRNHDLSIIDPGALRIIAKVPVGNDPHEVIASSNGTRAYARAYVACSPDDSIAVIDLRMLKVIGQIHAGGEPDGLAWAIRR